MEVILTLPNAPCCDTCTDSIAVGSDTSCHTPMPSDPQHSPTPEPTPGIVAHHVGTRLDQPDTQTAPTGAPVPMPPRQARLPQSGHHNDPASAAFHRHSRFDFGNGFGVLAVSTSCPLPRWRHHLQYGFRYWPVRQGHYLPAQIQAGLNSQHHSGCNSRHCPSSICSHQHHEHPFPSQWPVRCM